MIDSLQIPKDQAKGQGRNQSQFLLKPAKARALGTLAQALARSNDRESARKRVDEALALNPIDNQARSPNSQQAIAEIAAAEYRLGSIKSALKIVEKLSSPGVKLNVCLKLLQTCSRDNDIDSIEAVLEAMGPQAQVGLTRMVNDELAKGRAEELLTWLPRLKDEEKRYTSLALFVEALRPKQEPGR